MDVGPDPLRRYLRPYAHLFVEDGQEGEPVPTFHINQTTDLNSTSNPTSAPRHSTSQPLGRSRRTTTTHGETLSQATVELTEPLIVEYQPPNPMGQDDIDDTPDQQGWWDDADVSGLIDPKAFHRFLYSLTSYLRIRTQIVTTMRSPCLWWVLILGPHQMSSRISDNPL